VVGAPKQKLGRTRGVEETIGLLEGREGNSRDIGVTLPENSSKSKGGGREKAGGGRKPEALGPGGKASQVELVQST